MILMKHAGSARASSVRIPVVLIVVFLAFILCRSVSTSSYDNGVYNKMYLLEARPLSRGEQLAASLSNNYAMNKGTRCKVLACFSVKT